MINIVLVHGAWTDTSCWDGVASALRPHNSKVTTVELPLTALADDIAAVDAAVAKLKGTKILVGHGYGGAVISGVNDSKVLGHVYVSGFVPEKGESINNILAEFKPQPAAAAMITKKAKITIDEQQYADVLAADIDPDLADEMAQAQTGIATAAFRIKAGNPAWREIPCHYLISEDDKFIHPDAQNWMAERAEASITLLENASHTAVISHADEIAAAIVDVCRYESTGPSVVSLNATLQR